MEKLAFFDQKHGLTPLEKCDLWDCQKLLLLQYKKVSFFSKMLLLTFSSLILTKSK